MNSSSTGQTRGPTIDLGQEYTAHPVSERVFVDALRPLSGTSDGGLNFHLHDDGLGVLGSSSAEGHPMFWLFQSPQGGRCGLAVARANGNRLHLVYTFVATEHRRKGLYGGYIASVTSWADEEGFVAVCSQQASTANGPLIAKLKQGFLVEGLSLEPERGALLSLVRHRNADERRVESTPGPA